MSRAKWTDEEAEALDVVCRYCLRPPGVWCGDRRDGLTTEHGYRSRLHVVRFQDGAAAARETTADVLFEAEP